MELNRVFRGLQCQKVWKKNHQLLVGSFGPPEGSPWHGHPWSILEESAGFQSHGGTPSSSIYRWIFLIFHEIHNKPSI